MSQVNSDRRDYPEVATYMGVKYIVGFWGCVGKGFYYIPCVLCQCPRSQLVLSAVHDDNIECFLKSWCLKENIFFFCLFNS
jgi:hypothetical protein